MLEVESLTVHYEKNPILWDLSFSLPKGILCGIAGPNGAGKSTLLKALLGLIPVFSGTVSFEGEPLLRAGRRVAYIPQKETIDWDFPITAFDVVLMGRVNRSRLFYRPRGADREAAAHALDQLGMAQYAHRQISQLSGGQQQRLFLARALVQEPDLLLMDEPFSGVDLMTEELLIERLRLLAKEGKTILIVFHDLMNAERYFDWLLLLNRRLIACGPTVSTYNPENMNKTFVRRQTLLDEAALLSAKTLQGVK